VRRALRIWPLYLAFVLAVSALLRASHGPVASPWNYTLALLLFSGNWAMMLGWGPGPGDMVSGQLWSVSIEVWSVSIEEQFYLVWPLLLRVVGVGRIRRLALLLIGAAIAIRLAMDVAGAREATVWYSSFTWLDSIGAGALLAVALNGRAPRFTPLTRLILVAAGPGLWLLAAVVFTALPVTIIFYPLIVAGSVVLFLGAAGSHVFAHPTLVYLGRRSYGLYVLHLAGLALASFVFPLLTIANALAGFTLTVLMAAASYHWLETPFLALKNRFTYIESRPI